MGSSIVVTLDAGFLEKKIKTKFQFTWLDINNKKSAKIISHQATVLAISQEKSNVIDISQNNSHVQ